MNDRVAHEKLDSQSYLLFPSLKIQQAGRQMDSMSRVVRIVSIQLSGVASYFALACWYRYPNFVFRLDFVPFSFPSLYPFTYSFVSL